MTVPTADTAVRAQGLGLRFGSGWALRDCDFAVPAGRITGLVGPNGAGKSTLLHLVSDLMRPTTGEVRVFGALPGAPGARDRTAFLAQDKPLYAGFTVADTLRMGRKLNRGWDAALAESVVRAGDISPHARVGTLSPGQRTRIALAVVLGKKPDLLLLDEPLADLDPVVRHEVMGLLMAEVAERSISVVMSSHVLAELENVCDHVLLLKGGGVRLTGDAQDLCDSHTLLTGRADEGAADGLPPELDRGTVVEVTVTGRQVTAMVCGGGPAGSRWDTARPSLEELLLAHLRAPVPPLPGQGAAPSVPTTEEAEA
ncbi:ATP-binding cassette domain-containing protein [Streptomyces sp. NBC_01500]|uniref:ATP-binding cassette domain-containing protein n=1 Tax=Streptomyces sp. NBC_01500 TaxID=2903886 RepID=UPI00224D8018|nr:ABC transporter ATP-binding protein [Streptomyces sp. NBC_01500]MCX4550218.1 ABC transporter ATP-binding protein [Streptomyces sp. NBC_01500]